MIEIRVPQTGETRHRLPFFLALEEWLAVDMPDNEYFFTWTTDPTVIIGRNQCLDTEVNTTYCREHGIEVYRRRSGGGCVYSDRNNVMLSYVTPGIDVPEIFARYTSRIAQALHSLGIPAEVSGRNDILIDGCKVSGNAFYRMDSHSIVHGTLLWQFDPAAMGAAITPSRSKLESKRVQSVESRVTSIGAVPGIPFTSPKELAEALTARLCDQCYTLSEADLAVVAGFEQHYYSQAWLEGTRRLRMSSVPLTATAESRIEGVGEICLRIDVRDNTIYDLDITGDFFALADLQTLLLDRLRGCPLNRESVDRALADIPVPDIIRGLTAPRLAELILSAAPKTSPQDSPPAP